MEASRYPYTPDEPPRPTRSRREPSEAPIEQIDVWGYVISLWKARWLILIGTVVATAAVLVVSLLLPKTYEAMATVFVTPPTFASQLTPPALSVEAYERLARSDYIQNQVTQRLRANKVLAPEEQIQRFEVALYSSREPQKPYLPLLGLIATADTPVKAQTVANAWAEVFVLEGKKLAAVGKTGSVDFILSEFPKTGEALHKAEQRLGEAESKQQAELGSLKARVALPLLQEQMESRNNLLVALEEDAYKTRVELGEAEKRVAQLERDLNQTPQILTMSKAIGDDALWQAIASAPGAKPSAVSDSLKSSKLASESINPVHTGIAQELARARAEAGALRGRSDTLREQINAARADAERTRRAFFDGETKVTDLERKQRVALAEYERAVDQANASFKTLGAKIGDAQIAKVEQESDIKVGSLAELPRSPSSPDVRRNVTLGATFGFLLSLIGAWILEQVRTRGSQPGVVPVRPEARI